MFLIIIIRLTYQIKLRFISLYHCLELEVEFYFNKNEKGKSIGMGAEASTKGEP